MRKVLFVLLICALSITGCKYRENTVIADESKNESKEIQELKEKIKRLETELEEKNAYIEKMEQEDELFSWLSNKALEFVRGHTNGDIEKLEGVIADNISIVEENDKIYGKYEYSGKEIKYLLYDKNGKAKYQDMVIQGYGWYEGNNTYVIHIREFYVDENNESVSPPTFLNLFFDKIEGDWKIVEFEFDV